MPYGARRGRCAFRHSIWQAASSRSATSRLFIAAVIRASRRSPSPRGGRRNHRAAGRPEIARVPPARPVRPRRRGEHSRRLCGSGGCVGSSPRARGAPELAQGWAVGRRFIPAHTGNTSVGVQLPSASTVHPRAYGEHVVLGLATREPSVHPRAYGEHLCQVREEAVLTGSSPRIRGTLFRQVPDKTH